MPRDTHCQQGIEPNKMTADLTKMESLARLFEGIGLTEAKALETAGNKKLAPLLESVILSATSLV